jgi:hypothetical protein
MNPPIIVPANRRALVRLAEDTQLQAAESVADALRGTNRNLEEAVEQCFGLTSRPPPLKPAQSRNIEWL